MANLELWSTLVARFGSKMGVGRYTPSALKPFRGGAPNREDKSKNSFMVWPDVNGEPGGFHDHATGESGSLYELLVTLNCAPTRSNDPETAFAEECARRRINPHLVMERFHAKPRKMGKSPILEFPMESNGPTTTKIRRLRPQTGQAKEFWSKSKAKGGDGGACLYGEDQLTGS